VNPLAAASALLVLTGCGFLVGRAAGSRDGASRVAAWGTALPLGIVVLGFGWLLWAHLAPGRALGWASLAVPMALAALALLAWTRRSRRSLDPPRAGATAPADGLDAVGWIGLTVLVAQVGLSLLSVAADPRLVDWDGWAIWGIKARAFFVDGGVLAYLGRAQDLAFSWPARPPLTALYQAFLYQAAGAVDEGAARLGHWALFVSLLLTAYAGLRRRFGRSTALAWTALLATVPNLTYQAVAGVANVALGLYLYAALEALDEWESEPGSGGLVRAGLLLCGAVLVRDEGLALATLTVAAALLAARRPAARSRRQRLVAALGLALALVAAHQSWASLVRQVGASDPVLARWTSPAGASSRLVERVPEGSPLAGALVAELADPSRQARSSPLEDALGVALFWPLFALACLLGVRRWRSDPPALRCALITVGGLLAYGLALATYPDADVDGIVRDWAFVLDRHATALVPLAWRAVAGAFGPDLEARVRGG
jgi:hypothetical protein